MIQNRKAGVINIALVGPKTIQNLNSKYRNKSKPTDVLSFSRMETVTSPFPADSDLGDVLICWDVAKKQALEYKVSTQEELARLTVHGVLHLFGYDHERSRLEEKKMFRLQDKILKQLASSKKSTL
jgi:probable rRNA maturation factor